MPDQTDDEKMDAGIEQAGKAVERMKGSLEDLLGPLDLPKLLDAMATPLELVRHSKVGHDFFRCSVTWTGDNGMNTVSVTVNDHEDSFS